jgi:hypothetical protein
MEQGYSEEGAYIAEPGSTSWTRDETSAVSNEWCCGLLTLVEKDLFPGIIDLLFGIIEGRRTEKRGKGGHMLDVPEENL